MPTVVTVAYEHCYASSVSNPQDVYFVANTHWRDQGHSDDGLFHWETLSVDGECVRTASGLRILPDGLLRELAPGSVVILPAMNYPGAREFSVRLGALRPLIDWLKAQHDNGCTLCAHCTSSFVLAETGLLDGRKATTSWWLAERFRERYSQIDLHADQLVLPQGQCITGGATGAETLTALYLIERFMGPAVANLCAKTLLVDTNVTKQTPYLTLQSQQDHNDPLVSRAQAIMQKRMREHFSLEQLAARLEVSPRTLIRRFKQAVDDTPNSYFQNLRIETAKRLLESTGLPTEEVIYQVGYEDASSFSRLFQRKTGLTPRGYREKFAGRGAAGSSPLSILRGMEL